MWTDDQGYRRVLGHINSTKSYLRDGQRTKNTNKYLVTKIILSPTYGVDRWSKIPTGTWSYKFYQVLPTGWTDDPRYQWVPGLTNFSKSNLWGGQITQDIDGYLVLRIILSPTYGMDGWSRISTGTWSYKFYKVLPTGWTDNPGYWRVLSLTNYIKSYL